MYSPGPGVVLVGSIHYPRLPVLKALVEAVSPSLRFDFCILLYMVVMTEVSY